jgi:hypothetical protein
MVPVAQMNGAHGLKQKWQQADSKRQGENQVPPLE